MQIRALSLLAVMVGILLGAGGYTFHFADGLAYLGNDPASCKNCHIMNDHYDSWLQSSHHDVATCNDCHTPHALVPKLIAKADNGWNHSVKFTLGNYQLPLRIREINKRRLQHNCVECHAEMVSEISWRQEPEMHQELDCTRCHAGVGHGDRM